MTSWAKNSNNVLFCLIVFVLASTARGNVNAKLMTAYPHGFEPYRAESTDDGCFWITNHESQFVIANSSSWGQWTKIRSLPVRNARISANDCFSAVASSFDEAFLTTNGGGSWSPIQLPTGLAEQGLVDIKYAGNKLILSGASWMPLPVATGQPYPYQYYRNGTGYRSRLYTSDDLGKHWDQASVIGLDPPLGGMKLSVVNKDSIFFYAEEARYRFDFERSALSPVKLFSQCHSKQTSFAISKFVSTEPACATKRECFVANLDELLVDSNSEDERGCIFQDLFRNNAPTTGLKQLVVWGSRLVFLDRSGEVWVKEFSSENPVAISSLKAHKLLLIDKRLFAVSDVGILEMLIH